MAACVFAGVSGCLAPGVAACTPPPCSSSCPPACLILTPAPPPPADAQSTDGTEPSHQHTQDDLNCERGYEWLLLKGAKERNPNILTYGLAWAWPAWTGNFTGSPWNTPYIAANYTLNWLRCAKNTYGIDIDYIGSWNERCEPHPPPSPPPSPPPPPFPPGRLPGRFPGSPSRQYQASLFRDSFPHPHVRSPARSLQR